MLGFVRAGWRAAIYYPSRVIVDIIRPIVGVIVRVALVASVAALSGRTTLMGFGINELMLYYATSELLAEIPTTMIPWRIQDELNSGKMSITLSRPVEPSVWYFLFSLGRALPGIISNGLLIFLIAEWLGYAGNMGAFFIMMAIFVAFKALYDASIGLITAWTYHIGYIQGLMGWIFWGFLGGDVVPLSVMPTWFQQITYYLPFRYLRYDTIMVLFKGLSAETIAIAILWLIPMFLVYRWLYHKAIARAEAFGG
ncbi:MAG: hypothetical protein GXN93_01280 [Candidatus Diapherotrites archaeon]|nr:hypothetical protein [Candidatus Diapherotrites archaeon]